MFVNPPELEECRSYSEFKAKVKAWKGLTHVSEEQRGAVIAYNITNDSKFGVDLQDHIYSELDAEKLNSDKDGLEKVLKILDKYLQNTGMGLAAERFDAFLNTARKSNQSIKQYIGQYEKVCKNYAETIGSLSQMAKALMLLRSAKLSDTQYEMILAMSEGSQDSDTIYDKIKAAVITQLTDKLNDVKGVIKETTTEAAFVVQSDDDDEVVQAKEVLAASFYKKQAWQKKQFFQKQKPQSSRQNQYKNNSQPWKSKNSNTYNNQNQKHKDDDDDEVRCFFCRSKTHMIKDCIQAKKMRAQYQNRKRNKGAYYANMAEGDNDQEQESGDPDQESDNDGHAVGSVCLSDTFISDTKTNRFTEESKECAAIDTCCSQTVSGRIWFNDYKSKIPEEIKHLLKGPMATNQYFRFGDNKVLQAEEKWIVPAYLGDKLILLELYIIPSDIPMLLSKSDLQANDTILYMKEDMAQFNGKMVNLQTTTAGHYIVPLLKNDYPNIFVVSEILAIDILKADPEQQMKMLSKIHKQFGHRPKQAFVDVLKHGNAWNKNFSKMLDKIIDSCEGCILRKRNPDKPAVAMLMAKDVNDTVAMDLKKLKNGKHIIYLIDVFSRFTKAKILNRKKPEEVIDAVMEKWISTFGTPTRFITDNGGEFSNEEMQLACSKLNIIHKTTGANSPWQNGLCERNHATVDNILEALEQDYPQIPLETLLLWACVAKNSMLMVQGFSPYQIMFGKNPKLPNIITDPLPTWENDGISSALTKHLKAMKATRKAFIESEDSNKLKLALEKKVRTNNTVFHPGDSVYFKKAGLENWLNGKVIFQDGKVIVVRNGSFFYRCSANMVIKAGEELASAQAQEEEEDFETADEDDQQLETTEEVDKDQSDQRSATQDMQELLQDVESNDTASATDQTHLDNTNPDLAEQSTTDHTDQDLAELTSEEVNSPKQNQTNNVPNNKSPKKRGRKKKKGKKQDNDKQLKLANGDLVECKIKGVWKPGKVISRAGKATSKSRNCYNIAFSNQDVTWIDTSITETKVTTEDSILALWLHEEVMAVILSPEKKNSPECAQAKEKELEKLKEFDTYEEVPDDGQESISTTWVLTEKEGEIRARLTARGFEEESNVRSDSPTVKSTSLRFLMTMATTNKWPLSSIDIKSAFLQGKELKRNVYVKPPKEANCKGFLWRLKKCLYGLNDASKNWYDEMDSRFDLMKFQKSCQDGSFYFYKENGVIIGLVALHVDDFLYTGNAKFMKKIIPQLLKDLVIGKTETGEFTYTGLHVKQDKSGITLDQDHYLNSIEIPRLSAQRLKELESSLTPEEVTFLRQIMGKVNWVIRITRPDLSFDMVYLSTRFHKGTVADIKSATNVLTKMQLNRSVIRIPDLDDFKDLEIWSFSDASLGNIDDKSGSVGAYVIFMANRTTGKAAPIAWKASKTKRVATATLEAETLALHAALTAAVGIQQIAAECLGFRIPIYGVTDNYSSYEAIKSSKSVENARLCKEIASIKQMQKLNLVKKIMWLQGSLMIADCMTKKGQTGLNLLEVLQSGDLSKSMEAANGSEFIMTYDPKQDSELGEYVPQW